jgi:hypothetical protein
MMNGHGKSSTNVGQTVAEGMEGNGLAKGNLQQQNTSRTPTGATRLVRWSG